MRRPQLSPVEEESGPPLPRANPFLMGHDAAERMLEDAMASGRMHHAWLFTGPAGIGKTTLAYRFARAVFAGGGMLEMAPARPVFRRVAQGSHADLLTLELPVDEATGKPKGEIPVAAVRAVAPFLHLTAIEGGWRVVVVDGAEFLNRNAANALLKLLEEPPARALILLVCAAPGRLLPTIRSRCRTLRLQALDDTTVDALLGRYDPALTAPERAALVRLGEGSIGRALALAEADGVRMAGLVADVLGAAPRLPAAQVQHVADAIGRAEKDAPAYSTFMTLLRAALSQAVRSTAAGQGDERQRRLAAARPLAEWGEVWHALTRLQDETERLNLDKRVATTVGLNLLNGSILNAS